MALKVGLVSPYTWSVPGGAQQHIRDLADVLVESGHHVSVIAPLDDDATPDRPYLVPAGRAVPIPYNGSVARLAFGPKAVNRVRRWLREGEFDVLHVHEPAAPSLSLLATWIAADIPIVATFHVAIPRSLALSAAGRILQSALEKLSVRIAVSESARSTVIEHLGGEVLLIPNGIVVDRYTRGASLPGWPERSFDSVGRSIGFLGRIDEARKGLPTLLAAFNLLGATRPDLRLVVVGPGDVEAAQSKIDPRLCDRVLFLGCASEEEKINVLRSVDVFCAPNLGGESFGIVLAEAMASGAPVVASDIDAFRPVVENGRAGAMFRVGSPQHLAEVAGALLDDPERRRLLSQEAVRAARAYDWARIARDVVRVYSTVAPRLSLASA